MTRKSCQCKSCQGACSYKPGWFMPGEAEKAAALLQMPLKEFFRTKLMVDWWESPTPTFVLAPAIVGHKPGHEYPGNPRGACVFFKDGKCEIHGAKPYECSMHMHTDTHELCQKRKRRVVRAWEHKQEQIRKLLGRQPETQSYSIFDHLMGSP